MSSDSGRPCTIIPMGTLDWEWDQRHILELEAFEVGYNCFVWLFFRCTSYPSGSCRQLRLVVPGA